MADTVWYSVHFIFRLVFVILVYSFLFLIVRAVWREMTLRARPPENSKSATDLGRLRLIAVDPTLPTQAQIGETMPLDPPTTIGRGDDNDIVLDDPTVSRRHAHLRWTGYEWYLQDTSVHGTWVNGDKYLHAETRLKSQDHISIGAFTFEFLAEENL